jgi:prepilin-type N-terminal cleavage/methylation domain-containing protein
VKLNHVHTRHCKRSAFSLIEMVVVIAILLTLATAGAQLLGTTDVQTRKAGTDLVTNLVEKARSTAITSRRHVILAMAEAGDLPYSDERCRLGIFKVDAWPDPVDGEIIHANQVGRWRALERGLTISGGEIENHDNPLESTELSIEYGNKPKTRNAKVHAIAFNPRGGIIYPISANPIVLRVAACSYRNGKAVPRLDANGGTNLEQKIKIGRVTARAYRINE